MSEDIKINKNINLNSKALVKNLEVAVGKIKGGEKIDDVLTEVDKAWYFMSAEDKNKYRDKLVPRPTREYTRELNRIIKRYGPIQDKGPKY